MTPVQLANLSLLKIGHSKGIADVDEATREAWTTRQVYDHTLRGTLRQFPWPFATKYRKAVDGARHTLELAAGPLWDTDPAVLTTVQAYSGSATYERGDVVRSSSVNYYALRSTTNDTPASSPSDWSADEADRTDDAGNGDWIYAYRWPTDCLKVRRVVPPGGRGRTFNPDPIPFRIGRDANGLLIYTDQQEAEIEYTTIDCTALWTDDLFLDAYTWHLGSKLAPSISRIANMGPMAFQMYLLTISNAEAVASREQQQEKDGEADQIRYREG